MRKLLPITSKCHSRSALIIRALMNSALITSAAHQCPAVPLSSCAQQCRQSMLSVLTISAHKCCLSVPISATCQCPSLLHISAASLVPPHQCPPVPPHQCHLISAAYRCPSV
ncbi:unnamed protein product, partial [Staurois parvus]